MPPTKEREVHLAHKRGCPEERVERYEDIRPAEKDDDGQVVKSRRVITVVRCIDCGAHEVLE